jgi:hypothetical protein
MAKDIKYLQEFAEQLSKAIETVVQRQNFKKYMDKAADLIKVRTRLGYGVKKNEDAKTRLDDLSPEYVKQRQRMRRAGTLSEKTNPKKSNLTKTGQMLDNIVGVADGDAEGHIEFKGSRSDSNLTNAELAEEMNKTRPFFKLSNLEVKQLTDAIRKDLLAEVNKRLKR